MAVVSHESLGTVFHLQHGLTVNFFDDFSSTDFPFFEHSFSQVYAIKDCLLFVFFASSVVIFVDLTSKIEFCFTLSSSHKSNLLL